MLTAEDIQSRLDARGCGLEYIGGYENEKSRITLRCIFCGHTFERSGQIARKTYKSGVVCPNCHREYTAKRKGQELHERAVSQFYSDEWEYVSSEKRKGGGYSHTIRCKECGNDRKTQSLTTLPTCSVCHPRPKRYRKTCVHCGGEFDTNYGNAKYCSESCSQMEYCKRHPDKIKAAKKRYFEKHPEAKERKRKAHNVWRKRRRRENPGSWDNTPKEAKKILKRNGRYDSSVTLVAVYEKFNGTCGICGCVCDFRDKVTRDDGVVICGDSYPSIDHIKPKSKGGTHEWSNVRLLCRRCNYMIGNTEIL